MICEACSIVIRREELAPKTRPMASAPASAAAAASAGLVIPQNLIRVRGMIGMLWRRAVLFKSIGQGIVEWRLARRDAEREEFLSCVSHSLRLCASARQLSFVHEGRECNIWID